MLFTEIPFAVVQSFENHCKERLFRIQQERELSNKEADYDLPEQMEEDLNPGPAEESVLIAADKGKSRTGNRSSKIIQSSGFSKRHYTLFQISTIIAACLIYFVVTYWIEFGNIESILISGAAVVNWSAYRMTQFILTLDDMKTLLSQV